MADTNTLLGLLQEFPAAFADPEQSPPPAPAQLTQGKTQQLLTLIDEFPEAFADPEAAPPAQKVVPEQTKIQETTPDPVITPEAPAAIATLPAGYTTALQRRISTYTWGQVDCYLTYGETGLQQLWITVGKSGTEAQSLCEAIARLVNLLLRQNVPVVEIVKQLRGIRGGTPEGLGPHQLLGLADLIGKVLQEAPATVASGPMPQETSAVAPAPAPVVQEPVNPSPAVAPPVVAVQESAWVDLSDDLHAAALCPECGAQLQQINGCSGGACTVCGYSSCS